MVTPKPVLPSDSEASLTSFGTRHHEESPRLTPRGDKEGARGDKKRALGGQFFSFISSVAFSVISSVARNLLFDNWRPLGLHLGVTKRGSGRQKGGRGDSPFMFSRGTPVPRDPSLRFGMAKKYAQSDSRSACTKTFLFQPLSLVDKRGDGVKILTN